MEPRIETAEIKLVGVQAIICVDRSFVPDLEKLYQRLFDRLSDIPDLSPTNRTFGYWHFVDQKTRLHFAGVQVDSLEQFKWDHAGPNPDAFERYPPQTDSGDTPVWVHIKVRDKEAAT